MYILALESNFLYPIIIIYLLLTNNAEALIGQKLLSSAWVYTNLTRHFKNLSNKTIKKAYKRQIENYTTMEEQSKALKVTLAEKKAMVQALSDELAEIKWTGFITKLKVVFL